MKMTDIDKYSTELYNPEITLSAGSGDTPAPNYTIIAALAVLSGDIDREKPVLEQFVRERGMPGYCPTQVHIPSAVPFIGHAMESLKNGRMERAMFVAKGSLFLGRMSLVVRRHFIYSGGQSGIQLGLKRRFDRNIAGFHGVFHPIRRGGDCFTFVCQTDKAFNRN